MNYLLELMKNVYACEVTIYLKHTLVDSTILEDLRMPPRGFTDFLL